MDAEIQDAINAAKKDHEQNIEVVEGLVNGVKNIKGRSVWRRVYITARHKLENTNQVIPKQE